MIRSIMRTGFFIPLVLVALLAGILGFIVTQRITGQGPSGAARVSVISLPSTPSPSPTPPRDEGAEDEDGTGGGRGSCPSGCECRSVPPNGVVIRCG